MGKLYFFTAHLIDFFKYFLYFAVTIPLFKQQTHIFCRTYSAHHAPRKIYFSYFHCGMAKRFCTRRRKYFFYKSLRLILYVKIKIIVLAVRFSIIINFRIHIYSVFFIRKIGLNFTFFVFVKKQACKKP